MSDEAPQRNSSKTALGVAALRAVHQLLDGEPKILDDPISGRLLSSDALEKIHAYPAYSQLRGVKALRSHVVLRSRYAEDRMAEAARRGVRQCVVLGAGFDTFAYRQPEWAHGLRIYEVDHIGTQEEKRRRLQAAGIPLPSNLEFVAIDFESVSLRDGLLASTLDFSEPVFFSCLGVLMYLTREAANAVFELVAAFPAGSEIAFTYSTSIAKFSLLAVRVKAIGEPWRTHFEARTLARDLNKLGFTTIDFLSHQEAELTYYQGRTDGLHALRRSSIAAAIVGNR